MMAMPLFSGLMLVILITHTSSAIRSMMYDEHTSYISDPRKRELLNADRCIFQTCSNFSEGRITYGRCGQETRWITAGGYP
jgi:hypothetical protein